MRAAMAAPPQTSVCPRLRLAAGELASGRAAATGWPSETAAPDMVGLQRLSAPAETLPGRVLQRLLPASNGHRCDSHHRIREDQALCFCSVLAPAATPGQELSNPFGGMIGQARQHVSQPSPRPFESETATGYSLSPKIAFTTPRTTIEQIPIATSHRMRLLVGRRIQASVIL